MKKKSVLSAFLVLCLFSLSFTPAGAGSDDEDSDSSTESPRARRSSQAAGSTSSAQAATTEEGVEDSAATSSSVPPEEVEKKPEAPRADSPVSSDGEEKDFNEENLDFTPLPPPPAIEDLLSAELASDLEECETDEDFTNWNYRYRQWADTQALNRRRAQVSSSPLNVVSPTNSTGTSSSNIPSSGSFSTAEESPSASTTISSPDDYFTFVHSAAKAGFEQDLTENDLTTLEACETEEQLQTWSILHRKWKDIDATLFYPQWRSWKGTLSDGDSGSHILSVGGHLENFSGEHPENFSSEPSNSLINQILREDQDPSIRRLFRLLLATEVQLADELASPGLASTDTDDEQLTTWSTLHRKYADKRRTLVEHFYKQSPMHASFARRFKNRLYAHWTTDLVLSTGRIDAAPSPTQRFFKGLAQVLSLVPTFGGTASAIANVLGDTPETIGHMVELICSATETTATIIEDTADLGDGGGSSQAVAERLTDPETVQAELDSVVLLMMLHYCDEEKWQWHLLIDTSDKAERLADFAVARTLKYARTPLHRDQPLNIQLVAGVRKVSLDKSGWQHFLEKIGIEENQGLKTKDHFMGRLLAPLDLEIPESNLIFEWHMFGRPSKPDNWKKESPKEA